MEKPKPIISVIVPIYNVEDYLPTCLNSIAAQTFKDIEVILVDDGSTDKSGEICDEFCNKDNRFHVIHKKNEGVSSARNTGLDTTHGLFISFIDSDDYIHPKMLEILYNAIKETGCDVSMVKTKYSGKDVNFEEIENKKPLIINQEKIFYNFFMYSSNDWQFISVFNKLYKKEIANKYRFKGKIGEDATYNSTLFLDISKIALVDSNLYYYVQRNTSLMHNFVSKGLYIGDIKTFYEIYSKIPISLKKIRGYALQKTYKRMLSARYYGKGTTYEKETEKMINSIKGITLSDFTRNSFIPLKYRLIILIFLKIPSLYRLYRYICEKKALLNK